MFNLAAHRVPVNDYPSDMMPIPPSRMFLIRDALQKYKANAGENAPTYDASQGDGGASLPGVPAEILRTRLELQIKMGRLTTNPGERRSSARPLPKITGSSTPASGWGTENIVFVQGGRDGLQKAYGAMIALGQARRRCARRLARPLDQLQLGAICCRPECSARPRRTPKMAGAIRRKRSKPAPNMPPAKAAKSPVWSSPRRITPPDAPSRWKNKSCWQAPRWKTAILSCCSTGFITG